MAKQTKRAAKQKTATTKRKSTTTKHKTTTVKQKKKNNAAAKRWRRGVAKKAKQGDEHALGIMERRRIYNEQYREKKAREKQEQNDTTLPGMKREDEESPLHVKRGLASATPSILGTDDGGDGDQFGDIQTRLRSSESPLFCTPGPMEVTGGRRLPSAAGDAESLYDEPDYEGKESHLSEAEPESEEEDIPLAQSAVKMRKTAGIMASGATANAAKHGQTGHASIGEISGFKGERGQPVQRCDNSQTPIESTAAIEAQLRQNREEQASLRRREFELLLQLRRLERTT